MEYTANVHKELLGVMGIKFARSVHLIYEWLLRKKKLTFVLHGGVFDLQGPVVRGVAVVPNRKAIVLDVIKTSDGKQMKVLQSNPGHLKEKGQAMNRAPLAVHGDVTYHFITDSFHYTMHVHWVPYLGSDILYCSTWIFHLADANC